jgi:hypothetical protein
MELRLKIIFCVCGCRAGALSCAACEKGNGEEMLWQRTQLCGTGMRLFCSPTAGG